MRRSYDGGKTWSPVEELFPPHDRQVPASEAFIGTRFQTSNGFAVIDELLYAITDVAEWTINSIEDKERAGIGKLLRSVEGKTAPLVKSCGLRMLDLSLPQRISVI